MCYRGLIVENNVGEARIENTTKTRGQRGCATLPHTLQPHFFHRSLSVCHACASALALALLALLALALLALALALLALLARKAAASWRSATNSTLAAHVVRPSPLATLGRSHHRASRPGRDTEPKKASASPSRRQW